MTTKVTKSKVALTTSLSAAKTIPAGARACWAYLDSNVAWYAEADADADMLEYIPGGAPWLYRPQGSDDRTNASYTVKFKTDSGTAKLTFCVEEDV